MTQPCEVSWLNMFPTSRRNLELVIDRLDVPKFESGTFKAAVLDANKILFISSAISQSDAHVTSVSELIPSHKYSNKSPDFIGEHIEPIEFHGHKPASYRVAAWWKTIKNGEHAGAQYLCVALTPI